MHFPNVFHDLCFAKKSLKVNHSFVPSRVTQGRDSIQYLLAQDGRGNKRLAVRVLLLTMTNTLRTIRNRISQKHVFDDILAVPRDEETGS